MTDLTKRHQLKMKRRKAAVDKKIDKSNKDSGLLLVMTGNGKGKSSSGFGMVARALGHNMRVGIVQFIKGTFTSGEALFFKRFPEQIEYHITGDGFTWDTQNLAQDIASAESGWTLCQTLLKKPDMDMLLFDELNIVLNLGYLKTEKVLTDIKARSNKMQHIIVTGRGAPKALIDAADTVSQIKDIKHAFHAGIRAQKGIEL